VRHPPNRSRARIASDRCQYFTFGDAIGMVQLQQRRGDFSHFRYRSDGRSFELEMVNPTVQSRVEKSNRLHAAWVGPTFQHEY